MPSHRLISSPQPSFPSLGSLTAGGIAEDPLGHSGIQEALAPWSASDSPNKTHLATVLSCLAKNEDTECLNVPKSKE